MSVQLIFKIYISQDLWLCRMDDVYNLLCEFSDLLQNEQFTFFFLLSVGIEDILLGDGRVESFFFFL